MKAFALEFIYSIFRLFLFYFIFLLLVFTFFFCRNNKHLLRQRCLLNKLMTLVAVVVTDTSAVGEDVLVVANWQLNKVTWLVNSFSSLGSRLKKHLQVAIFS